MRDRPAGKEHFMKGLGNRQRAKNPRKPERTPYAAKPGPGSPAPGRQEQLEKLKRLNARGKPR